MGQIWIIAQVVTQQILLGMIITPLQVNVLVQLDIQIQDQ